MCLLPADDIIPWTAVLPGTNLYGLMQGTVLVTAPLVERLQTLRWSPRL